MVRPDADDVEQRVLDVATEDVARHELGGRHVFQRRVGEDLAGHLCLREFHEEAVFEHRVHLEGVTQAHLLFRQTGNLGQLLVDEVGGQHGMRGFHGVGGGQVVVLTRVDDDAREAVDDTAHILVDEGALHVDVAEQDAVEGVVQHDIEAFESAHDGDFGHAETRAVVAEADVAAYLLAHFVQGLTHDAEVLLRGEGAAKALGGGAVRHIVQEALACGADHGDDVGSLTGTGLGLHHILVDVTRGHNNIKVWLGAFADGFEVVLAAGAAGADACQALVDDGLQRGGNLFLVARHHFGDVEFAFGHLLGDLLRVEARLDHGVGDEEQDALAEHALVLDGVHHHIGQRHIAFVHPVDAHQSGEGALHGHRGVLLAEGLHIVSDVLCQPSCILHFLKIKS